MKRLFVSYNYTAEYKGHDRNGFGSIDLDFGKIESDTEIKILESEIVSHVKQVTDFDDIMVTIINFRRME